MKKFLPSLFLSLTVSGSAIADDGAVLRCRQLADAPQRLSCYDAMPAGPLAAAATLAPRQPAAEQQAREQAFGMELGGKNRVDTIESTIPGRFEGWGPRQQIRLANGQLWVVSDGSDGVMTALDPKVVISRGVFGVTYMEVEGLRKAFRVKRLQ